MPLRGSARGCRRAFGPSRQAQPGASAAARGPRTDASARAALARCHAEGSASLAFGRTPETRSAAGRRSAAIGSPRERRRPCCAAADRPLRGLRAFVARSLRSRASNALGLVPLLRRGPSTRPGRAPLEAGGRPPLGRLRRSRARDRTQPAGAVCALTRRGRRVPSRAQLGRPKGAPLASSSVAAFAAPADRTAGCAPGGAPPARSAEGRTSAPKPVAGRLRSRREGRSVSPGCAAQTLALRSNPLAFRIRNAADSPRGGSARPLVSLALVASLRSCPY